MSIQTFEPLFQIRSLNQKLYDMNNKQIFGNICDSYHNFSVTFDVSQLHIVLEIDSQVVINTKDSWNIINHSDKTRGPYYFTQG